jgi:hypothetical protein
MFLHCEMEHGFASWLGPETLESLVELNQQCLELMAEQAAARAVQANLTLRQIGEIWRTLDSAARRRAASCPYLLVDAGFSDPVRWRWAAASQVGDRPPTAYLSFFTVPGVAKVSRLVFNYAWSLARYHDAAARFILGMPAACSTLIRAYNLPQIHELADRHPEWLKPRWPTRARFWRELLLAAGSGEIISLESAQMHGLQLLAAESLPLSSPGSVP